MCTLHSTLLDFQHRDPANKTAGEGILGPANLIGDQEFNMIYNSYIQELVKSFDNIKQKFSTYAAKCLSDKQRRDCGISLAPPVILLPYDQHNGPNEETKESNHDTGVRMGGRMGLQIQ
jgi:hypothetical protein